MKSETYGLLVIVSVIAIIIATSINQVMHDGRIDVFVIRMMAFVMPMIIGVTLVWAYRKKKPGESMVAEYSLMFGPYELWLLLFKKKKCPYCGSSELKKKKKTIYQGKGRIYQSGFSSTGDKYKVNICYQCAECNREFGLSDIGKAKKNK